MGHPEEASSCSMTQLSCSVLVLLVYPASLSGLISFVLLSVLEMLPDVMTVRCRD